MSNRKVLSFEEKMAVKYALDHLVDTYGNQRALMPLLKVSQQSISRAQSEAAGAPLARALLAYLKTDMPSLVKRFERQIKARVAEHPRPGQGSTLPRISAATAEIGAERGWSTQTQLAVDLYLRASSRPVPFEERVRVGDGYQQVNARVSQMPPAN